MKISDKGLEALIAEEGEVLRAYKDTAGIWTIGVGLTKASGVIDPKPGMTITKEQSRTLLRRALERSYEPETEVAMSAVQGSAVTRPSQSEFDAGLSFHFNTGAISRASWVKLWKAKAPSLQILASFKAWSKAGGKVLPALEGRRAREWCMLIDGRYRVLEGNRDTSADLAQWGLVLSDAEKQAVISGLQKLGFVGPSSINISLDEAKEFQRASGLTVDGILGRASLSTLQRLLDAKSKAVAPTAAVTATGAAVLSGVLDASASAFLPDQADSAALVAAGIWLASHLWSYRTELFGWLMPAPQPGA